MVCNLISYIPKYKFISSLITSNNVLEILCQKNIITRNVLDKTVEFFRVNNCIRDSSLKIKNELNICKVCILNFKMNILKLLFILF